jgi:CheY-like chemotaxis protein
MTRILIVDDAAVDRKLAGGLLESLPNVRVDYANNGKQALDHMGKNRPDMVITDLQMPEMDGLQLVTQVRARYPAIPVILMTGKGSEEIAVEALQRGAASYVPKSQLSSKLRQIVEEVLCVARAGRSFENLLKCQTRAAAHYELDNDPDLVDALVELLQQIVQGMGLTDDTATLRVGVALREALLNALYHGNLQLSTEEIESDGESLLAGGPSVVGKRCADPRYRDRKIAVDVTIDRQRARFVIQDQGAGFDYARELTRLDPASATESLESGKGRGFLLMLALMDEVSFNESGNRVTMVKEREHVSQ